MLIVESSLTCNAIDEFSGLAGEWLWKYFLFCIAFHWSICQCVEKLNQITVHSVVNVLQVLLVLAVAKRSVSWTATLYAG
jgi:hypothetical protein